MGLLSLKMGVDLGSGGGPPPPPPAPQDLTTYTQIEDFGATYNVTVPKVDIPSAMQKQQQCSLYYDFGASFFGDFIINFEIAISGMAINHLSASCTLANSVNFETDLHAASDGIAVQYKGADVAKLDINLRENGIQTDVYQHLATSLPLTYCTIARSGTGCTLDLYSDSGRTTVIDNLVLAGVATTRYRYLYALNSWGPGGSYGTRTAAWYSQNFSIISAG